MSVIGSNVLAGASGQAGGGGYEIERSLRFNSGDSAYLNRTPSTAGNRKTWTWSGWFKNSSPLAGTQSFFAAGSNGFTFRISGAGAIEAYEYSGGFVFHYVTSALYRDPSAWYHIVLAVNTDDSTASDRIKIYVNGSRITAFATSTSPSSGATAQVNSTVQHEIGNSSTNTYLNGYLADIHFIDGQALAPTDFGEPNTDNLWVPKEFDGSYNTTLAKHQGDWEGDVAGTGHSSNPIGNSFDGNNSTGSAAAAGTALTFTPSTAITGITKVRINASRDSLQSDDHDFQLNGTNIGGSWTAGGGIADVEFTVNNLTTLKWATKSNGHWYRIYRIDIYYNNAYYTLLQSTPGDNSFHLDFADNSSNAALGTDTSGNNNTWTVNNLIAVAGAAANTSQTWSSTSSGFFGGSQTEAYDGNLNTVGFPIGGANANCFVTFNAINASKIEVNTSTYGAGSAGSTFYATQTDGTQRTYTISSSGTTQGWITVYDGSQISINKLGATRNSSAAAAGGQRAWRVDGVLLVNTGTSGFETASEIDSLRDSPTNGTQTDTGLGNQVTGNYATLNPLAKSSNFVTTNGDLALGASSGVGACLATIAYPKSGKWYHEIVFDSVPGYNHVGVARDDTALAGNPGYDTTRQWTYWQNGRKTNNVVYAASFAAGDVIGVAFDADAGSLTFYKNGASQGVNATGLTSTTYNYFPYTPCGGYTANINFGQRAFAYPLSGYKCLNTANLPTPTIADGSLYFDTKLWTGNGSDRDIGGLAFQPDFVWIKKRNSSSYGDHMLYDGVRGATKVLKSNSFAAEVADASTLDAFNSDSFSIGGGYEVNKSGDTYASWTWDAGANSDKTYAITVANPGSGNKYYADGALQPTLTLAEGSTYKFDQSAATNSGHPLRFSTTSDGTHGGGSEYTTGVTTAGTPGSAGAYTQIVIAASAPTLYAYCTNHSGMGFQVNTSDVEGATNLDGTIASQVMANPSAGFSIVSYTGGAANSTVGHGLNAAPYLIICKSRNQSSAGWDVYHRSLGKDKFLILNETYAEGVYSNHWGTSEPNSTVFGVSQANYYNNNGNMIALCFSPVEGYSAMGSYVGNGSTDGTFVFTGFEVAWLVIKSASSGNWLVWDNKRSPHNLSTNSLVPNDSNAEATGYDVDLLSNGFKLRDNESHLNGSATNYVYAAFASNPFASNGGLAR